MKGLSDHPNDRDATNPGNSDFGSVEMGTVGWDDGNTYLDLGTASNDGNTLVAVQLYRGRDQTQALKPGVAQGHKIWCQISSMFGIYWLPSQGTRVLVAVPAGMGSTQGAPLIVGAYQTSGGAGGTPGGSQFKVGRVMWDVGSSSHALIKGKSATMQSYSNPAQWMGVGTPMAGGAAGVYALDETGSGFSSQAGECAMFSCSGGDVKSTCHLTASSAELINKGSQTCGVQATSGDCKAFGANFKATCGMVYLGPAAVSPAANGVAITVAGPTNVISTTVFASV
jgi:hypothetical protein